MMRSALSSLVGVGKLRTGAKNFFQETAVGTEGVGQCQYSKTEEGLSACSSWPVHHRSAEVL